MGSMVDKANKNIQIGLQLANSGKYDKAIKYFKKAAKDTPDVQPIYFIGLGYQKLNKLDLAEKYFKKAQKIDRNIPQPLNGLGLIYFEKGDYKKASDYFKAALVIDQYDVAAMNNLGNTYKQMKEAEKAIECYKKAINLNPSKPNPYCNLGTVYFQEGNYDKALTYLKKAIKIDPNYSQAEYHLAILYRRLKDYKKAEKILLDHIRKNPTHIEGYGVLGNTYLDIGDPVNAKKYFDKALKLNPKYAQVYNDLGNYYRADNKHIESIKNYHKALLIDPKLTGAASNLGIAYVTIEKLDLALKHLNRAIKLDKNCVEAYYHLGIVYEKKQDFKKALWYFEKAFQLDPKLENALPSLVYNLMQSCGWNKMKKYEKRLNRLTKMQIKEKKDVSEPAMLHIARVEDLSENQKVARSWSRFFERKVKESGISFDFSKRKIIQKGSRQKRIKVGYLSYDFFNHATGHLMRTFFENHNKNRFEIYTYSYGPDDRSSYRKKIIKDSEHFIDISSFGNIEAAKKIYSDGIDILVDLKGHTRYSRFEILALKPAPVAITWLGFPGTTGSNYINYIVADKVLLPEKDRKYYSEEPIYLPCYQINDDKQKLSKAQVKRSDFGLPKSGFVFASFNYSYKISKKTFKSWMNILKRVEGSVLWVFVSNNQAVYNLKKHAKSVGVNPNRLIFAKSLPKDKHLKRMTLSGLALDTFTYNGHTTTSDCLWAGVPVVTLCGKHFASRVSASLLEAVGLPELIANTPKAFEDLAVSLSQNQTKLKGIKKKLRTNLKNSTLFNTNIFVKNLEREYLKVARKK